MKTYSITIQHNELETTSHVFKTLSGLDIFANIIESEAFVPFYGLHSYYDLEKEINELFYNHPESISEWEWVLNVADFDYMTAWDKFSRAVEQNEIDFESDWEIKSNERHLMACAEF